MVVRDGEISRLRQTPMDESNNCAMECQRGAVVRRSDPHSRHSVHNTAVMYVAGASQASDRNTFGRRCVEKKRQKSPFVPFSRQEQHGSIFHRCLLLKLEKKKTLQHRVSIVIGFTRSFLVRRRRWRAGVVRLEASYAAEFDAGEQGALSA